MKTITAFVAKYAVIAGIYALFHSVSVQALLSILGLTVITFATAGVCGVLVRFLVSAMAGFRPQDLGVLSSIVVSVLLPALVIVSVAVPVYIDWLALFALSSNMWAATCGVISEIILMAAIQRRLS